MSDKPTEPQRPPLYSEYRGPGPAYKLKPLTGREDHDATKLKAPAYSISLPIIHKGPDGPGPSQYQVKPDITVRGPAGPPPVTIKGRTKLPELRNSGPAPGAYDPGNPDIMSTKRSAPAPRIGTRYSLPDYKCSPGPTAYSLPDTMGSGSGLKAGNSRMRKNPTWTLRSRMEHGSHYYENMSKNNPSPSAYSCPDPRVYKKGTGRDYSLQGRTQLPSYNSALQNPAPGAYNAYKKFGENGKGCSMGVRHSRNMLVPLSMEDMAY